MVQIGEGCLTRASLIKDGKARKHLWCTRIDTSCNSRRTRDEELNSDKREMNRIGFDVQKLQVVKLTCPCGFLRFEQKR